MMNTQFNKTLKIKLHVTNKHTMCIIYLAYENENTKVCILLTIIIEKKVASQV